MPQPAEMPRDCELMLASATLVDNTDLDRKFLLALAARVPDNAVLAARSRLDRPSTERCWIVRRGMPAVIKESSGKLLRRGLINFTWRVEHCCSHSDAFSTGGSGTT